MGVLPKAFKTLFLVAAAVAFLLVSVNLTRATSCTTEADCQSQINQQSSQLSSIQKQQADLQSQLNSARSSLNSTQSQLNDFQTRANDIQNQLTSAQTNLDKAQVLFKQRVKDLYERGGSSQWDTLFLNGNSFEDASQFVGLKQAVLRRDINLITKYTGSVKDLNAANKTAKDQLAQIQAIKDAQAAQLASIQSNNNSLSSQIAKINSTLKNLSSQQQQIIAAKLAATSQSTTVGNSAPASSDPGLSPYHPGFLFLDYGYPHRIGMNQYGAYGRALAGQGFQTILQVYYGQPAVGASEPSTISVQGYGVISFEEYLKGIGEVPISWPLEAQKAQAVAARSYAWNWVRSHPGQSICTDQNCQVYIGHNKGGLWEQAVNETARLVLGGNNPIAAFYSSTDGGYTCTDFYHNDPCTKYLVDAPGGVWNPATAYDNASPWFHKAWGSYNGTAWLSATDTADLFNAAILSGSNSNYNQYLSPQASGGWSYQRIVQELQAKGLPFIDQASAIGVGMDGSGNTNAISVVGVNGTAKQLDGQLFRSVFDLRSPGTLTLFWSSLYDVQKAN